MTKEEQAELVEVIRVSMPSQNGFWPYKPAERVFKAIIAAGYQITPPKEQRG